MTQLTLTTSYVLGDTIYASGTNVLDALGGNTSTTKKLLSQTGTGSASAAPSWQTLDASDYPVMVGDSGAGGTRGAVPAPAAGDAAAGKFLKADGSWAVPGSLTVQATNATLTVKTSGGDFTTVSAALNSLRTTWIANGTTVTIQIDPMVVSESAAINFSHPQGAQIVIQGTTVAKSLASIQSSTGSSGNYSIVLNLNSVTSVSAGDYVFIPAATGGTNARNICGCWKILSVDSVNNRVTIKSTIRTANVPSGAVTASITVLRSKIAFTNTFGFQVLKGIGPTLKDLALDGTAATASHAIAVSGNSVIYCSGVGTDGWSVGFLTGIGGFLYCDSPCCASNSVAAGFSTGGFMGATGCVGSGSQNNGMQAQSGGRIIATNAICVGNTAYGAYVASMGSIRVNGITVGDNFADYNIAVNTLSAEGAFICTT